ncbi:uncharacterized protein [Drosophila kikkawai]|uniref:Uncharacterized protein n=1 Tax=Drosophila kikkawai TaxID=30033 RepID=A0A6P4IW09_DROKI|nr:uncharacterized protein LOC108077664 [Drosophila kikkawai]
MSCKAPGLFQDESNIELSIVDVEVPSELDLDEVYDQLERMKQRVLQMKSMIIRPPATTTDPVQAEFEKLADSDNPHLREVQQETSRGFLQIDLVRNRLSETTKELVDLAARIQESERCTKDLAKKLDEVPKWIEESKHQAGLCMERHNELSTTLLSDLNYSNHMRPLLVTLSNNYSSKISVTCYRKQYKEILDLVQNTRLLLNQTHDQLRTYTQIINDSFGESTTHHLSSMPDISGLMDLLEQSREIGKKKRASSNVKPLALIQLTKAAEKLTLLQKFRDGAGK